MTLTSAALSLALPSQEDIDKDSSLLPPHLIVLMDLHKGSSGESTYFYLVLVDSGTTYNFISQYITDKLRPEAVKAGRRRKKMQLPITTVNSKLLQATAVVRQVIRMRDSIRIKLSHVINFVIANIAHYDIILDMAWLQKENCSIHRDTGVWH